MRFKTKDLSVSIEPNVELDENALQKLCVWGTRICIRPTLNPCGWRTCGWWLSFTCHQCSFLPTFCACTLQVTINPCRFRTVVGCVPTVFEIEDPSDIVTLRKELGEAIQELERLEREGLPNQIRTAEEAEQAEKALENALEEIRRQRKNLK